MEVQRERTERTTESRHSQDRVVFLVATANTVLMSGLFLAGLWTLFYDSFPLTAAWMGSILSSHVSFAILTGFFSAFLFAVTYLSKVKGMFYLGLAEILSVAVAAAGGLGYYAMLNPLYSYVMAIAFVFAYIFSVACMFWSL